MGIQLNQALFESDREVILQLVDREIITVDEARGLLVTEDPSAPPATVTGSSFYEDAVPGTVVRSVIGTVYLKFGKLGWATSTGGSVTNEGMATGRADDLILYRPAT